MAEKQWEPLTTPEAVVESVKAGLHVEPALSGWHQIETAPKDGSVIDLWRPSWGGERLCNYKWVQISPENGYFRPAVSGYSVVRDATHWMPLPERPMTGWHPVETAPKDGTRFRALSQVPRLRSPTFVAAIFVAAIDPDGVMRRVDTNQAARSVTHWMPIPEPPNE